MEVIIGSVIAGVAVVVIVGFWRQLFGGDESNAGNTMRTSGGSTATGGDHSPIASTGANQINESAGARIATGGSTIVEGDQHNYLGPTPESSPPTQPRYWRNRPAGNANSFYGRDDQRDAIVQHLRTGRSVVLSGGAGVGKTRLAVEAATGVGLSGYWISASAVEITADGLLSLVAVEMGVEASNESQAADGAEVRIHAREEPLLIVFDNLDSVDLIAELNTRIRGQASFLVTTRDSASERIPPGVESVQVDVIDLDAAAQLLCSRSGGRRSPADETIREIARSVGRLPLALEMLAVRLGERITNPDNVLRQLNSEPNTAEFEAFLDDSGLQDVVSIPRMNQGGVFTAIRTSLVDLEDSDVTAIAPLGLLADAPASRRLAIALTGTDEEKFERVVEAATRRSVIRTVDSGDAISLHSLTGSVIRALRPVDPHAVLKVVTGVLSYSFQNRPLMLQGDLIHYKRLYTLTSDGTSETALEYSNSYASALLASGHSQNAISIFASVLEARERTLGNGDIETLTSRNNLATAYQAAGHVSDAIPLFESVLKIRSQMLGDDDRETLTSQNNLAYSYLMVGRLKEAISLFEATLGECERTLGDEHSDTLGTRNNLGLAYQDAGRLSEALPLFESTLDARERRLGKEHPNTLSSRNNLGRAYFFAGRVADAIPLYEVTLGSRERTIGKLHPDTLISRNNLAGAYVSVGRLKEALRIYETTLQMSRATLGEEHPSTLLSRNNLAYAYQADGRLQGAIALYEPTLEARERTLGDEHPDTLTSRNNLAYAYQSAGRTKQAISLYQLTIEARVRTLGEDHPDTLTSRNNLAGAFLSAGRLSNSIQLFESNLETRERRLGREHPDTLMSRIGLAGAYAANGRLSESILLYEPTVDKLMRSLGEEHSSTLTSKNNLAGAYQAAGRLKDATLLYESTLKTIERTLGKDHPDTLKSRNNLATTYQEAGRLQEAIPLYKLTLEAMERKLGENHPDTISVRNNLTKALAALTGGWTS